MNGAIAERPTILHLIDTGGPGGAETVFRNLVVGLRKSWRSVAVIPVRDWLHEDLLRHGIEPIVLEPHRLSGARHLLDLTRLIRHHGVDLVQTHLLGSAVYGTMAAAAFRVPLVSTFHGVPDFRHEDRWLALKLRILSRNRNRIVFVSSGLRDRILAAHRLPRSRTRVVYNGLELGDAGPGPSVPRDQLGAAEGDFLIGAIGNLRPSKDYGTFLQAVAVLEQRGVPIKAVIAGQGEGQLRDELLALRSSLGLEGRVRLLGFRPDVDELLRALDVFVTSSRDEGFSLSTIEALAQARPVVATRSGGPEEILRDGQTGILVPIQDPVRLADAVERLYRDPSLARALGAAGARDVQERFTLDRMIEGYETVYRELLRPER